MQNCTNVEIQKLTLQMGKKLSVEIYVTIILMRWKSYHFKLIPIPSINKKIKTQSNHQAKKQAKKKTKKQTNKKITNMKREFHYEVISI